MNITATAQTRSPTVQKGFYQTAAAKEANCQENIEGHSLTSSLGVGSSQISLRVGKERELKCDSCAPHQYGTLLP
jgi:hypothetical protein